jgi:hypothetical protein
MDPTMPYEHQFDAIRKIDWTGEQIQVDLFCELLQTIKNSTPSMIELGSQGMAGSFYSVLFEKFFRGNCKILNVEPTKQLLDDLHIGWKDKHLINTIFYNGFVGVPKHYHVPQHYIDKSAQYIKMKDLLHSNNFDTLDILHADIQGSEVSLLEELQRDDLLNKIRYLFISTHSGEINTYYPCMKILTAAMNCKFHFFDPTRGGWGDGLIVAENVEYGNKTTQLDLPLDTYLL